MPVSSSISSCPRANSTRLESIAAAARTAIYIRRGNSRVKRGVCIRNRVGEEIDVHIRKEFSPRALNFIYYIIYVQQVSFCGGSANL